jgi:hypothetical protein
VVLTYNNPSWLTRVFSMLEKLFKVLPANNNEVGLVINLLYLLFRIPLTLLEIKH